MPEEKAMNPAPEGEKGAPMEAENHKEPEQKPISDPGEILRELCKGKMELMYPFRARGQDVAEIPYDFCALTGEELMDALDRAPYDNMFRISNRQAMHLFAATAEKEAPPAEEGRTGKIYDAKDIMRGLKAADAVKAAQLAKLFYNASSQAGNRRISKK